MLWNIRMIKLTIRQQIFQSKMYEKLSGRSVIFLFTKKNRDDDRFHRVRGTSETEVKCNTHDFKKIILPILDFSL